MRNSYEAIHHFACTLFQKPNTLNKKMTLIFVSGHSWLVDYKTGFIKKVFKPVHMLQDNSHAVVCLSLDI